MIEENSKRNEIFEWLLIVITMTVCLGIIAPFNGCDEADRIVAVSK